MTTMLQALREHIPWQTIVTVRNNSTLDIRYPGLDNIRWRMIPADAEPGDRYHVDVTLKLGDGDSLSDILNNTAPIERRHVRNFENWRPA